MRGGFGPGFDEGQKKVQWIAGIAIAAFFLWFLYEGFKVVEEFIGFSW